MQIFGKKRNSYGKRKRKNEKNQSGRLMLVLIFLLFAVASVGLLLGMRILDRRLNEKAVSSDALTLDDQVSSYIRGTLSLGDEDDFGFYNYYHNFENYLIMGTDASGNEDGEGEDFQNSMADFLLLMSIDKTADTFALLEINRDTMTEVPMLDQKGRIADSSREQLCTAHWYGPSKEAGCENQVRAVSMVLGELPINGYYCLSMDDIPKLNAAIGGVTVTLTDDFSKSDPQMVKGATLTLTDDQAYIYLRSRMNVGHGTNEERMARQHTYLTAFLEQSREKISGAPRYYYNLFDSLNEFAITNLTGKQISRIAKALTQNKNMGLLAFEGESRLGKALSDDIEHAEFYPDPASVVEVMTKIFSLVPDENGEGQKWYLRAGYREAVREEAMTEDWREMLTEG